MYGVGVMPGRWARSGDGLCIAESPKQGSKRFNLLRRQRLCPSSYIIYLWIGGSAIESDLLGGRRWCGSHEMSAENG